MLSNHISKILIENFEYTPTTSQYNLIDKLSEFIVNSKENSIFLLKGFAGTGKTTIINSLVKTFDIFKINSVLLAPTGRAAKVLSHYSQKNAYTIHKKIYRQKSMSDGLGIFVLDLNFHSNTYFIVDESSMIANQSNDLSIFGSGKLLDDLMEYVFNKKNCKLILIGDTAQLPPVGIALSPALNINEYQYSKFSVYEYTLTDIVRQYENSGILFNATEIRNLIENHTNDKIEINLKIFDDIIKITGEYLIEEIADSYNKFGIEDTIVITRSNKQANRYNQGIRNRILFREEQISVGDYLMIVKNNYHWIQNNEDFDFIANGDIVEIIKIYGYEEKYGFNFANIKVRFIDYKDIEIKTKILLNTLSSESAALSNEDNKKLFYAVFEDYNNIKGKRKRINKVREDSYFNALQVKFAYAVTCHKAQGGQWKSVFIDHGYISNKEIDFEFLRWLYTALTRAIEKIYLVNFNSSFFNEPNI